jgi:hypothetical protein
MRAAWHCGSVAPIRADAARKAARFFASLCPRKYFIILPGQIANGFSSSPSNTPPPFNGGAFPHVTIGDDVVAQHRLITERYGAGSRMPSSSSQTPHRPARELTGKGRWPATS